MKLQTIKQFPLFPTRHRLRMAWACVRERLHGLDFTMPDRMFDRGRGDGAMYQISSSWILRELLASVDPEAFPGLLDIGCGKGFVLHTALEAGFSKVGGLEYDEKMLNICRKNMDRLGISCKVTLYHADACTFRHYGNYRVFYFFNPFDESHMRKVLAQILEQCQGLEIILIYYHPRYAHVMEEPGCFTKIRSFHDPEMGYDACLYRGKAETPGTFC